MKKAKKAILLLLIAVMAAALLCSCGKEKDIAIETSVGTLRFPPQWADTLVTEEIEGDGETIIVFRAKVADVSYDLFYVVVADNGAANAIGTITGPDKVVRNVYIDCADIDGQNGLNDEDRNTLYVMQEDVNYLLQNLK